MALLAPRRRIAGCRALGLAKVNEVTRSPPNRRLAYAGRPFHRCRTSARKAVSANTMPSPMAGSLKRIAASDAPHAAPAICEKPNRAAARPALSPNGDSAAALDSGLAIPTPNRKIEAVTRNGSSECFATSTATSSATPPTAANPRPTSVAC